MKSELHILYEIAADPAAPPLEARVDLDSRLAPLASISRADWRDLKALQGGPACHFLRMRYGSPATHLLLARCGGQLAHVEWVVPAAAIRAAYPFVREGAFAIIACVTAPDFRGQGIYPSQIRRVTSAAALGARSFYIWATAHNSASLKGIERAGGVRIGTFTKFKAPLGLFRPIELSMDREHA